MKLESRLVDNEYRRDVITIGLGSGILQRTGIQIWRVHGIGDS